MNSSRLILCPLRVVFLSETRRVHGTVQRIASFSLEVNQFWRCSFVSISNAAFLCMILHRNGFTRRTSWFTYARTSGCAQFRLKYSAVYARATRGKWKVISAIKKRAKELAKKDAELTTTTTQWAKRGETHRELVFRIGHEALRKARLKPPQSFKEARKRNWLTTWQGEHAGSILTKASLNPCLSK
jgi:hypothetical protein